jgi:DNA-binding CsgD family transcriptional regulator
MLALATCSRHARNPGGTMLGYRQVEAAARMGMLTRERDSVAASAEALRLLTELLPTDAATVIAYDPFTGTHFKLAGINCPERVARLLSVEFVNSPWYQDLLTEPLPPTASCEAGRSYRNGWFYQECVRAAGLRDTMGGALHSHGRYVGMVHLTTEQAGGYTTEARQILASLLPPLAALADSRSSAIQDLAADASAVMISRGQVVDLPGRDRPTMMADDGFRRLIQEFAESGGDRLRVMWLAGQDWYRVELSRHRTAGGRIAGATLVSVRPAQLPYGLSLRELEVLTRATMGQTDQAIADELFLSLRTVHSHIQHVLRKTGTAARAEAAALAIRAGLLCPVPGRLKHFIYSAR